MVLTNLVFVRLFNEIKFVSDNLESVIEWFVSIFIVNSYDVYIF